MHLTRKSTRTQNRRTGLAPLELVLALPLLLFVTALIVNFADSARWKIRAQANANYASSRSLSFRSGGSDPNPLSWPLPATLSGGGTDDGYNVNSTDPHWSQVPDIGQTILLQSNTSIPYGSPHYDGQQIGVRRGSSPADPELEMHEGVHRGRAEVSRRYHQAPAVMPNDGSYEYDLSRQILDNDWNFANMGYWSNSDRRVRLWYRVEPNDVAGVENGALAAAHSALKQEFADPERRIYGTRITPLDEDYEFLLYRGSSPNFHPSPRVNRNAVYNTPRYGGIPMYERPFIEWPEMYGLDTDLSDMMIVHTGPFGQFLDQVRRRPGAMARAFISLYRGEIARQKGNPPLVPPQPPPPGGESWQVLEGKVSQLEEFLDFLRNNHPEYL